ncbi:hypothetical protein H1W00_07165 [Aeromicrobium sp. Marseille-Q0843]|uniref:PASTA domain-containing protein n=1 Tax=Aeromicrobium phoceense TaxID=2754045 RepID=A0A838XMS6_9ACTN|nr:PASTA domain-containing protein [Aeromicrobium phoceense]MBA4608253.1 hypothetical protein [Aeromicrobium phoceense]
MYRFPSLSTSPTSPRTRRYLTVIVAVLMLGISCSACGEDSGDSEVAAEVKDQDSDGVPDDEDAFPRDASESSDVDGNGVGDKEDARIKAEAEAKAIAEADAKATAKAEAEEAAEAKAAESFKMPKLAGENLQLAQDMLQALGSYGLIQNDALELGRFQVLDANWKVCAQKPKAGKKVPIDTIVELDAVKLEESCP